ncbi:AAA family ATPase [Sphingomonas sp.]|uniref:chromosome segregation SMC family protein n=1 Tax=Sphingomonas sp. TaxID=28214 RepID=UPI00286CA9CF|nr:AAA family ATPase [Sphingomonas sp.]
MKIRRLKLGGFKSFVESAELGIEPGLTGVVGPNGCGKSNLLEAIRWVMGEASAKSLRGGGMEDVIFAGTATRAARDFAEVSLLIERDGQDELGGESEITRRIERGAGSAYRVDGRDVRQKDVSLLFADAATGAHSPALVSQGRIGAVIAAKPTERRQMLEEAAGISGLHARRKDAEQKLRAAEVNITRLDELLSDQELRAATLRRQARAAERYRSLTDRIRAAEAKLLFARWDEAQAAAGAARGEAEAAELAVGKLQRLMAEAQRQQEAAAVALGARRTSLVEARDSGRSLAHALATARARRDTIVRRLAELDRLELAQASESAREEALRDDAAKAIATLQAEQAAIAARLSDGEAQAARLAADVNAAEIVSRGAETALAEVLAREAAMRAERRVAEAALEAAQAQADRTAYDVARIEAQIAELGDGADHREARAAADKNASEAAGALAAAEQALAEADAGRAGAAEQRDGAESALASARAALAAATSERGALADALAQGGSGTIAVQAAPGYERALAAALGDDLDAGLGGDGPRRWIGSEPAGGDPKLADGLERLSDFATAPLELARRLAQVGVAPRDDGQPLGVGQRLVTRDGLMRRWDGFVATNSGAATAERLIRANRLAELDRALPALELAVAAAVEARDLAAAEVENFRSLADDARAAAAAAERQSRDAVRAGDAAANAIDRLDAQRAALVERRADLDPLIAASVQSLEAARKMLISLPEPKILEAAAYTARSAASTAGEQVADCRAAAATRARELAADRERDAAAQREAGEWRERSRKASDRLIETADRAAALAAERAEIIGEPEQLAGEIVRIERDTASSEALVGAATTAENEAEQAVANAALALRDAGEGFAAAREARAGAVARAEAQTARREELARECGEKFECPPPLLAGKFEFDATNLAPAEAERETFERLTAERERLGPVNLVAESELAELDANRAQGAAERDELQEAINRLRGSIGSLNREGRVRLLDAFEKVNTHFQSLFTTLFDGGHAHLELVESDDPLEAGLEILAQPPGKRLTALTLLSGGEQALTAVALIFGLFLTNPAPICVLDEVDAPLDDANVDRFCDLLDRMTAETDTRYLIVTHNAVTMARMHRLYGVTMIEQGVSRLVSVDLGAAERLLAAE